MNDTECMDLIAALVEVGTVTISAARLGSSVTLYRGGRTPIEQCGFSVADALTNLASITGVKGEKLKSSPPSKVTSTETPSIKTDEQPVREIDFTITCAICGHNGISTIHYLTYNLMLCEGCGRHRFMGKNGEQLKLLPVV